MSSGEERGARQMSDPIEPGGGPGHAEVVDLSPTCPAVPRNGAKF
jgi:hypothetical protein